MTRQKKEIINKIEAIQNAIDVDMELGAGFGSYNELYEELDKLNNELAILSHYDSVEEMFYDMRGCGVN